MSYFPLQKPLNTVASATEAGDGSTFYVVLCPIHRTTPGTTFNHDHNHTHTNTGGYSRQHPFPQRWRNMTHDKHRLGTDKYTQHTLQITQPSEHMNIAFVFTWPPHFLLRLIPEAIRCGPPAAGVEDHPLVAGAGAEATPMAGIEDPPAAGIEDHPVMAGAGAEATLVADGDAAALWREFSSPGWGGASRFRSQR